MMSLFLEGERQSAQQAWQMYPFADLSYSILLSLPSPVLAFSGIPRMQQMDRCSARSVWRVGSLANRGRDPGSHSRCPPANLPQRCVCQLARLPETLHMVSLSQLQCCANMCRLGTPNKASAQNMCCAQCAQWAKRSSCLGSCNALGAHVASQASCALCCIFSCFSRMLQCTFALQPRLVSQAVVVGDSLYLIGGWNPGRPRAPYFLLGSFLIGPATLIVAPVHVFCSKCWLFD